MRIKLLWTILAAFCLATQVGYAKAKPSKIEQRKAFEKKMFQYNYSQLLELAEDNKKVKGYIAYLSKKGVKDIAGFEQYKVKQRVEKMQKYRPRRWSETGHSDQRAQDPYKNPVSDKAKEPEPTEEW